MREPSFTATTTCTHGVALGRTMLVSDDLAAGRLMRPFKQALRARSSFYLVYPPDAIRHRKVKAFHEWLLAEIGERRSLGG